MKIEPIRTCIVTREKLNKKELVRIVVDKNLNVSIDYKQNLPGRGFYLQKKIEIIEKAKKSKILNKKLKTQVKEEIYNELIEYLKKENSQNE